MSIRIFNVKSDGSYTEVPPKPSTLEKGNGAFIIVSRTEKKIYVYRKPGISRALAYAAARAATNLNTRKGSRYQIINLEPEERKAVLNTIFPDLVKQKVQKEETTIPKKEKKVFVIGEASVSPAKTIVQPAKKIEKVKEQPVKETLTEVPKPATTKVKRESAIVQIQGQLTPYNIQDFVKVLASKLLFEANLESIKTMQKPPRDQLRSALIRELDALLDELY
ncbi:MAG: hypothetical protein ACTSYD_13410 [Candidatus Heimdallarchaeaceae archaeon]